MCTIAGTSETTIRGAYSNWPQYNQRAIEVVATMTPEQLALVPAPGRWPLWATAGHAACQRVSWLCGFAGEPGAESTPFPNALHVCPGDEDLENVLDAGALVAAMQSTFHIIERCLDTWTLTMLGETLRRTFGNEEWVYTRGSVIQRVFAHDLWHWAGLNESLAPAGLPQIDIWD